MTIKSMTGFGRGELEKNGRVWTAEIRCVNNRYLDLKMKLPRGYTPLEEKIRKMVAETHLRGRVDLMLSVSGDFSDLQEVKVNMALAGGYRDALQALSAEFGLVSEITPQILAAYPEVLIREQQDEDLAIVWEMVEKVVATALQNCDTMRCQEGKTLAEDLTGRLQFFEKTIGSIEKSIPELLEQRQKNLQERLDKLLANVQLDPARLAQEVAVMADKTDVTEEIVRLRCHISQFTLFLTEESGIGRKLDFLIQEFLREVNTLASKINDAAVAHLTVDLKSELEKMREQVQNIE
ncbi:YicC family protein [Desulfopila sp. IMCC35006]|uniref:YicC/YloC family endoribonuclease n=1 Tax=Desulfopila sp. IMCC35006 TaxID=2569542 RepID=UPI0010AD7B16|nr:YicC/YloC family endoribonuclease [Desulfopila sp. IMCC35006]TKB24136.1 YicC family protein [Desulfopila sp. IMCC35006]